MRRTERHGPGRRDSTDARGANGVDRRWWIGEGPERCTFCLQGYALEMEVRCVSCDADGCMHCMVTVAFAEGVVDLCPPCASEAR